MKNRIWIIIALLSAVPIFGVNVFAKKDDAFRPEQFMIKVRRESLAKRMLMTVTVGCTKKICDYGASGGCFDPQCSMAIVNYHTAILLSYPASIKGEKVLETSPCTDANDEGAMQIQNHFGSSSKFTPVRDVAFFRLERSLLRKGMHGLAFSTREVREGEEVDIYGYPDAGRLATFPAHFLRENGDGVLEFGVQSSTDGRKFTAGMSGGFIVNREHELVGSVWAIRSGGAIVQAVPIWSMAECLKKKQPVWFAELFPGPIYKPEHLKPIDVAAASDSIDWSVGTTAGTSPQRILPDELLKFGWEDSLPSLAHSGIPGKREAESAALTAVRASAEQASKDMENFFAHQEVHIGGGRTPELIWSHEVRIAEGRQTFRELTDGKKEVGELPYPTSEYAIVPDSEWSDLIKKVGTDIDLRMEEVGVKKVLGIPVRVFRYEATAEDRVCRYSSEKRIIWRSQKDTFVACRGEVWTDEYFHVLRIMEIQDVSAVNSIWRTVRIAAMYGSVDWPDDTHSVLPLEIAIQGEAGDKGIYWSRVGFGDYRKLSVTTRIGPTDVFDK